MVLVACRRRPTALTDNSGSSTREPRSARSRLPTRRQGPREELCYEFARANPDASLAIVRPCVILGPHVKNYISRMLEKRIIFGLVRAAAPVHPRDDAVRAIFRSSRTARWGSSTSADGALTLGRMAEMSGRRVVRLPVFLLAAGSRPSRGSSAGPRSASASGYIDYALYPWCRLEREAQTELLFMFKYDALRAFSDYLDSRTEPDGTPRVRSDAIVDVDDDDLNDLEEVDET